MNKFRKQLLISLLVLTGMIGVLLYQTAAWKSSEGQKGEQAFEKAAPKSQVKPKQAKEIISSEFDRITVSVFGDPRTQRGFCWYTKENGDWGNDLQVTEAGKPDFSEAICYRAVSREAGQTGEIYHQAVAKGLKKGIKYKYRVGDAASGRYSRPGVFQTAGEGDACTVLALSDTQATDETGYAFAEQTFRLGVEEKSIDFIINAGDVVNEGEQEEQWKTLLNTSSEIFQNYTMAPVGGNHIPQADILLEHFTLASETGDRKADGINYSFDYGCVHFMVMDSNEKGNLSDTVSDAQVSWLKDSAAGAKAAGAQWLVLVLHKGLYTIGNHAMQEEIAGENGSRNKLAPVLEELEIDLVIQGHDHIPSCTYPLTGNGVSDDGVVYLEMGAAGQKTYTINPELSQEYLALFAYYDTKLRESDLYHNYAVISADKKQLQVKLYEAKEGEGEKLLYETVRESGKAPHE